MKAILFLTMLTAVALTGCAKPAIITSAAEPGHTLHISRYRELNDPQAINNAVGYLNPGDVLPVKLTLTNEWFDTRQSQIDLIAKQKIYFRVCLSKDMTQEALDRLLSLDHEKLAAMSEKEKQHLFKDTMLYAGKDGKHWAPIKDPAALKQLFGIEGGMMSIGLSINSKEGIWASFTLALKSRQGS